MTEEYENVAKQKPTSSPWIWLGRLFRLALTVAILAGSAAVAYHWMKNPPQAKRRPPRAQETLVDVQALHLGSQQIVVEAMGTVIPARKIQLASRVAGHLQEVHPQFEPGGRFETGETVLRVDRQDYELAVAQLQANLVKTESSLKLEMGQQSIAQREYELLGEFASKEDETLVLRQPQLDSSKATIAAARASLEKAKLDLKRTNILAPFNAMVQSRNVDLGSFVSPGAPLATLIDTDTYWIEVSVPVDELPWIQIPGRNATQGSAARIDHQPSWGKGVYRDATVEQLMTELEPGGLMARLLLAVSDPLHLEASITEKRPLLLDLKVGVDILCDELSNVVDIPRTALRNGNFVWIMSAEKTLEIREVSIAWGGKDHVYLSEGIQDGDLLITSDLAAPVAGMLLRTAEDEQKTADAPRKKSESTP
jgi:RND family efflux transporter MFP subunit